MALSQRARSERLGAAQILPRDVVLHVAEWVGQWGPELSRTDPAWCELEAAVESARAGATDVVVSQLALRALAETDAIAHGGGRGLAFRADRNVCEPCRAIGEAIERAGVHRPRRRASS